MDDTHAKILVVENEARVMQSVKELLELHDYQVQLAADSREAIRQLKRDPFDLVLLDAEQPSHRSHCVLDFIDAGKLPIAAVVLNDPIFSDVAVDALKRGADDVLPMPYAPEQLIRSVGNAIRKQRFERDDAAVRERLLESEKLHRYLVERSPDLIYMLDSEGRFTFINSRVESLLGFRKSELLGMHYSTLVYGPDEELSQYVLHERRTGRRASHNVEMRLKRRDGGTHPQAGTRYLTVEINSTGVYSPTDADAPARFRGTYGLMRDISERKEAEAISAYQASHDLLTRLPNRFLFKDRLSLAISQARRNPTTFAVMFLDLDNFKTINDTLGHLIGDQLLQSVGTRVFGCLREGDTLARAGGDEFMLLLPQAGRIDDAAEIARKILDALRNPFMVESRELFVTVSIGIALYPEHGINADALIRRADVAMYAAKAQGRDAYALYDESMSADVSEHVTLENDMREALRSDQFQVFYQPQINIDSGEVIGLEALVRWRHPRRALLTPDEFIPVAEDSGLILSIDEWVLREACREMSHWRAESVLPVRVSVNLSARQFEQPNLAATIAGVLHEFGLPSGALEIEITEEMVMKNSEETARRLRELGRHGITAAIDDFGTGYASLSYLRRLPINTLKLDYAFVHDIHTSSTGTSIAAAIVSMAESLDLTLIAEGVETEVQMDYLRSIGCHIMQGFMLSPPLPADAAREFVEKKVKGR
jgi:diguanylate cyclase (GGDEF)-like protein/PAS domain S-box-containing protein